MVIVHQVYVFESNVLIAVEFVLELYLVVDELSLVSSSFQVISLVNVEFLVKDVPNHHKINRPVAALVLHLIQPIDTHQVCFWTLLHILGIVFDYIPQLEVLLSTNGLHYHFGVVGVVNKTPTFACLNQ